MTNQPDWGTLAVIMTSTRAIDDAAMLRYILSFRQHNGFHEQCGADICRLKPILRAKQTYGTRMVHTPGWYRYQSLPNQ